MTNAGPFWGMSNLPPRLDEPHVIMVFEHAWDELRAEVKRVVEERDHLIFENRDLQGQLLDSDHYELVELRAEVHRLKNELRLTRASLRLVLVDSL